MTTSTTTDTKQEVCPARGGYTGPNHPSKCTWKVLQEKNPHVKRSCAPQKGSVMPNILHAIGETPLVKLNRIPQSLNIECDVYVKCEFMNPGGSVKDRIGARMLDDAEAAGLLTPGCTIIEPTSGNTGIGVALACAVRGYQCIIVMPDNMSAEKNDTMLALGARVVRTPAAAAYTTAESHFGVAQRLNAEIANSVILNQYANANNPLAHHEGTGEEILRQSGGHVDMVVCGAGTGGTVAGIGRLMREKCPDCIMVLVEPKCSKAVQAPPAAAAVPMNGLSLTEKKKKSVTSAVVVAEPKGSEIEGIGYQFMPTVLDGSVVDRWATCGERVAFQMARRLIREEGILCGGSSGAALSVALKAARDLRRGQRCVVILPDGIRNYMSKFVSDNWMEARKYRPVQVAAAPNKWWWTRTVEELLQQLHGDARATAANAVSVSWIATCGEALDVMRSRRVAQANVVKGDRLLGALTMGKMMGKLVAGELPLEACVNNGGGLANDVRRVELSDELGLVARILEKDEFVVVDNVAPRFWPHVTRGDLLEFVAAKNAPAVTTVMGRDARG